MLTPRSDRVPRTGGMGEEVVMVPVVQGPTPGAVWAMLGVIAGAGAIGGIANALLGNNSGIVIPKVSNGILQLGVIGNVLLGAFAAIITWGLYGPLKDAVLLGSEPIGQLPANLTVTAVVGAALAGAGGARVVSNELDKRFYKSAATEAAQKASNPALAAAIASGTPAEALAKVREAP
jgi:hypothetical protein